MNWIGKVLSAAGGLAFAITLLNYALGFGWLSLIAALPTFMAVIVLVPFFLGVRDRRVAAATRLREGKRRRRRKSRPGLALANRGVSLSGGARRESP
jgi:hypothetical protein